MAKLGNTMTKYDSTGIRESLSDVIYDISPAQTPVLNAIGKEDVENTLFEWQTDALAAPNSANKHLEGDEASNDALTSTTRVGNICQISKKVPSVTGTAQAVKMAGRKSEMARQVAKKAKELKRDMETIILSNQPALAGDNNTARQTAGIISILKTNTDRGATGANPVYVNGVPTTAAVDGTLRALTEAKFQSVMQSVWSNGGEPAMASFAMATKQKASTTFAGIAQRTNEVGGKGKTRITASVDVYVCDAGTIALTVNRYQRSRDVLILDTEYLSVAYLRRFKREPLAKSGDATREQLVVEWGLKYKEEKAHGLLADIDPTL